LIQTDLEDAVRLWAGGILLVIMTVFASLVLSAVGIGVTALFQTQETLSILAWIVIFIGVLPFVYMVIAKYLVEWLFD